MLVSDKTKIVEGYRKVLQSKNEFQDHITIQNSITNKIELTFDGLPTNCKFGGLVIIRYHKYKRKKI
jgi:hypothetical protein